MYILKTVVKRCYMNWHLIFNKIAIQGTPQMAVDKEARAYRVKLYAMKIKCKTFVIPLSIFQNVFTVICPFL